MLVDVLRHLEHRDLTLAAEDLAQLLVGVDHPPVDRVLQLVLLDVAPDLLGDLSARLRDRADHRGERGARGHRLHERGIRLPFRAGLLLRRPAHRGLLRSFLRGLLLRRHRQTSTSVYVLVVCVCRSVYASPPRGKRQATRECPKRRGSCKRFFRIAARFFPMRAAPRTGRRACMLAASSDSEDARMRTRFRSGACTWALVAALAGGALPAAAQAPASPPQQAVATFAGGCFWCMEPPF